MTELHNSVLAFLAQQQQREREEQEQPGRKLAPKFSIGDEDDEEEHEHSNSQAEENPEGHGKEENGKIYSINLKKNVFKAKLNKGNHHKLGMNNRSKITVNLIG